MLEIELPYPPSVNHYYRRVGPRTLISRQGRRYRERICAILRSLNIRPIEGRLALTADFYPPDRRRRDLDNLAKCLLDALQHGGAYHDDSQIKEMHTHMREPMAPRGKAVVRVTPCLS
jgi:crossover junction endodeoxyribonuclease RusA